MGNLTARTRSVSCAIEGVGVIPTRVGRVHELEVPDVRDLAWNGDSWWQQGRVWQSLRRSRN